jgi:AraC family transcriptional regulator
MTVARLTCAERDQGMIGPFPPADAFFLSVQLGGFELHDLWLAGRPAKLDACPAGAFTFIDLNLEPSAYLSDPVDSVCFYVPRATLEVIADEEERPRVSSLQLRTGAAVADSVVRHLAESVLPALIEPALASRLFMEHVSLALLTHVSDKYGGASRGDQSSRGRLAPWQERRIKDLLLAHLDGDISLDGIARECGISRSHLIRAFSRSTGLPPHRWLLVQRVERARDLLLNSDSPIVEIASRLGFADQSHLTRAFSKILGCTPGALRRARTPRGAHGAEVVRVTTHASQ